MTMHYPIASDGTVTGLNKYYSGFNLISILNIAVTLPDGTRAIEAEMFENGDLVIPIPTQVVVSSTGATTYTVGSYPHRIVHYN